MTPRRETLKKLALTVVVFAMLTVVGGTAGNAFQNWNLNRLHPVPGKMYKVDSYAMHMYCVGQGSPTVLLESGLGNDWLIWQSVQPKIAATHRVCSYDRAGLGWSVSRPGPRGALTIAQQLNKLLKKAEINDKLIFVGHSAGGLYVREFAGLFPRSVAGLVLVEASSPEFFRASPQGPRQRMIAERHREAPWLFFKVAVGLARLTSDYCNPNTSQRIPAVEGLARAEDCRPEYMNSWLGEWDDFESSAEQVSRVPCCGSIPLVIVSQEPDAIHQNTVNGGQHEETWDDLQEGLKRLSSRSMRIVARHSKHFVMVDRPDVVMMAIASLQAAIGGQDDEIPWGQTIWR